MAEMKAPPMTSSLFVVRARRTFNDRYFPWELCSKISLDSRTYWKELQYSRTPVQWSFPLCLCSKQGLDFSQPFLHFGIIGFQCTSLLKEGQTLFVLLPGPAIVSQKH